MNPTAIGPYIVLDKLGSGGMGSVYLGRHQETGEVAAVKVLTPSLAQEEGFVERFNREIAAMRKLENPRVVRLYDNGVDGDTYYYAMEYVPGETLMALLRRSKRVSWQHAVDYAIQICQALKAAHDAGIIHRDLKPSNLLITPEGMIKLTDFGVAQVFSANRLTMTGGIIGTAEFMSPEQAQGKRVTKQSDLYALGAVLYVLVTGRPPFAGNTAVEVIQKHKFGLFDRPRLIAEDLPIWFEELICQLLEKDPAKRFPDALVLQRRIEQELRKAEVHENLTLIEGNTGDRNAPTVARSYDASGPGPATAMKDLVRATLEADDRWPLQRWLDHSAVLATLLLLTIAGGVWWFWPRDAAPEDQFAAGVALMEQPAGPDWITARRQYFEPLLQSDPETWQDQVAPYLQQIKFYELSRPSGLKRLRKPAVVPQVEASPLESEAERFLQLARHYEEQGDLGRAEKTARALRSLLAGDPGQARLHDLADQYVQRLQRDRAPLNEPGALPRASLARAEQLVEAGRIAEARALWEGIVDLYAEDDAAASCVIEAQRALERYPAPATPQMPGEAQSPPEAPGEAVGTSPPATGGSR